MFEKDSPTGKKFQEIGKRVRRDFGRKFDLKKNGLPDPEEAKEWLEAEFIKYYSDMTPPELVEIATGFNTQLVLQSMVHAHIVAQIVRQLNGDDSDDEKQE